MGSMDCVQPEIFEMVAVGAMASTFEFLMPCLTTCLRSVSQSRVWLRSTSISSPR